MSDEPSPSLAEVIRRCIEARLVSLHTAIPARVTRYDAATQQVDAQPLVKDYFFDEQDDRQVESLPVVPGVPVLFQGAGQYRLTFPIQVGTLGLLIFSERSLDRWLAGAGAEVDPKIDHRFDLSDGVFIPELLPFGAPRSSAPTDHATIGHDSGAQIHMRQNEITIGDEAGSAYIARSDLVDGELSAIALLFDGLIAPGAYSPSGVAASQGKVK